MTGGATATHGDVAATVGGAAWLVSAGLLGLAAAVSTLVSSWMRAVFGGMALVAAGLGFWLPGVTRRAGVVSVVIGIPGAVAAILMASVTRGSEPFWFVAAAQALALAASELMLVRLDEPRAAR